MFWQNVRIFENKLAEGSAFLDYNGIHNDKNLQNPKIFIFGTKTCLYQLICHSYVEEDQTKPVCFMKKKNQFDQEKFDWFEISDFCHYNAALHCNGKNLESQIWDFLSRLGYTQHSKLFLGLCDTQKVSSEAPISK